MGSPFKFFIISQPVIEGLCKVRLKKQHHLSIKMQEACLICGRALSSKVKVKRGAKRWHTC